MTATHTLRPVPVTAVQYTDNIPAIEAAFGPATLVWVGRWRWQGRSWGVGSGWSGSMIRGRSRSTSRPPLRRVLR
jgi:hypothetical protein